MNRITLVFSTLFVSFYLLLFAQHGAWKGHLLSDTDGFFFSRAAHFIENGNLQNMGSNEYQPGAVIFFLLASPLLLINDSVELYRQGIWGLNLIFFWIISYVFYKKTSLIQTFVFQLIILSAGPILLYRFELYVFLMIFFGIYFLQNQKYFLSGFWLSLATLTKIFPIILIPYILFYTYKKTSYKGAFVWLGGFIVTFCVFLSLYTLILKTSTAQLLTDLSTHSKKPVHVESLWGSGLTWWEFYKTGEFAKGKGAVGIFGIDPDYQIGSLTFYNYFWIIPWTGVMLWGIWRHWQDSKKVSLDFLILIMLIFIIFSKIVTPQYLFWFAFLIPLLDWSKENFNRNQTIVFIMLLLNTLSQYIYPLSYSQLLGEFYATGTNPGIFNLLTLRNLLLVFLCLYIFMTYPKKSNQSF